MAEPVSKLEMDSLEERTAALMQLGLKNFDALHLASAESEGVCAEPRVSAPLIVVAATTR